jgi:hypothetical protein
LQTWSLEQLGKFKGKCSLEWHLFYDIKSI